MLRSSFILHSNSQQAARVELDGDTPSLPRKGAINPALYGCDRSSSFPGVPVRDTLSLGRGQGEGAQYGTTEAVSILSIFFKNLFS
jgi:hypothetical protein